MDENAHRIAEKFVNRNVHALATHMVAEALRISIISDYHDDVGSLMGREQDAEEALREHLENEKDPHTLKDWAIALSVAVEDENEFEGPDAWADDIRGEIIAELELWDSWREACWELNLEIPYHEALEHWVVSSWLAERLEERGEIVAQPWGDMWIWGRTTSGQAIAMDGVIAALAEEFPNA